MFTKDLKTAQEEERILAQKLIDANGFDGVEYCNNADYDIKLFHNTPDGKVYRTYELKCDYYQNDRVAIEVFCLNRLSPTGLMKSKADKFVIKKKGVYYFIRPEELKGLLKPHMFTIGGDNGAAVIALLDTEILKTKSNIMS